MTRTTLNSGLQVGDCRQLMRAMPAKSIHCVVTSPPYWAQRDYEIEPVDWADGTSAVLGLEETPEAFVAHLVEVFQEVRRVLRDDGVVFLNLGDSYAQGPKGNSGTLRPGDKQTTNSGSHATRRGAMISPTRTKHLPGLKPGDLLNMPHRVAAALQADGWYWRSTIVWHKRSPMPESVSGWRWVRHKVKVARSDQTHIPGSNRKRSNVPGAHSSPSTPANAQWEPCPGCKKCRENDGLVLRRGKWRPTAAHEYVFLFSKRERYFCDGDAVQESVTGGTHHRGSKLNPPKQFENFQAGYGHKDFVAFTPDLRETRNPRSVWTLSSEPYKGLHFATYPSQLVRRCIEAGTSGGGCCSECEAPYAPIVETKRVPTRPAIDNKIWKHQAAANGDGKRTATSPNLDPQRHIVVSQVIGYRTTCGCAAGEPIGAVVFDPFAGSGTTLQTARVLGRRYIGCEISADYVKLAEVRIAKTPKWAETRPPRKTFVPDPLQKVLF